MPTPIPQRLSRAVFAALCLIALVAVGCTKTPHPPGQTTTTQQDQVYTCPMHPEVLGKAGDKCPKCGMALEPKGNSSGEAADVAMRLQTEPETIEAGKSVDLILTPASKQKPDEKIELEVEHTKKIHLIMVSQDLSFFDHIHPEEQAGSRAYSVKTTLPAPGPYLVFADYRPTGGTAKVDRLDLSVAGEAPPATTYSEARLTDEIEDGFSVTISTEDGNFLSGQESHLTGKVSKNGQPFDVNNLEDYLGEKAHMVVLSLQDKEYLHVHPGVENSALDLHTTFAKPGLYRGWLQFQSAGKVYTSDFVFSVAQGKAQPMDGMKEMNGASPDAHGGH